MPQNAGCPLIPTGSREPVGNGNQAVADYLDGILAEVKNYKFGAEWSSNSNHKATNAAISNFSCWDATDTTAACLHFDSNSSGNHGDLAFYNFNGFGVSPIGVQDDGGNNNIFDPNLGWFGKKSVQNYVFGQWVSSKNHSVALTSGSPVNVLEVPLGSGSVTGGRFTYTIIAQASGHNCTKSDSFSWMGENTSGVFKTSPSTAPTPAGLCTGTDTLTGTVNLTGTAPLANLQFTETVTGFIPSNFTITYSWNATGQGSPIEP